MTPASAPGKLFLFGEYAVLSGCACVVAAVDRRVHARRHGDSNRGYHVEGASMSGDTRLVDAILARTTPDDASSNWATDVSALYDARGLKLGLGSSAATTVAIARAASPELATGALFDACFDAHRQIQAGRGSGADIAASTFGGLLSYQLHAPQRPFPDLALPFDSDTRHRAMSCAALAWPEDLRVEAVWLGSPASSSQLIASVERALDARPEDATATLSRIRDTSRAAIQAFRARDVDAILDAARLADDAMAALAALIEEPLRTTRHQELVSLSGASDLVAKTSGAGAGDFSLLFGRASSDWSLLDDLPHGFTHVPLTWCANGARLEHP